MSREINNLQKERKNGRRRSVLVIVRTIYIFDRYAT